MTAGEITVFAVVTVGKLKTGGYIGLFVLAGAGTAWAKDGGGPFGGGRWGLTGCRLECLDGPLGFGGCLLNLAARINSDRNAVSTANTAYG